MSKSDVVDDATPTTREVIAAFMAKYSGCGYRGLRDYIRRDFNNLGDSQDRVLVPVPGRGMVNLRDFNDGDEQAFTGVPIATFQKYHSEFRARINAQSRRLRELGLMTPKGMIVLPDGHFLYNPAELSEVDMQALEAATVEQLAEAYCRVTHCTPRVPLAKPASSPASAPARASRNDRRPISSFVPPYMPKHLDRVLSDMV